MELGLCLRHAGDGHWCGAVLARPGSVKRQRGNLVGFVKSSFFKVRRFHDEEDLRRQLRHWLREVNEERPCRATGVIPAFPRAVSPLLPRSSLSPFFRAAAGNVPE